MANRYDQNVKDEVVAFIQSYNEENGRGGQSAAVKKWNLNPITVKTWLEKAGVETPGRGGKKKRKPGRPAGRAPKVARKAVARKAVAQVAAEAGDLTDTLNRMVAIHNQIAALQSEYAALKAKL